MTDCCENGPAVVPYEPERDYSVLPENLMNRNTNHISFAALSASEQQAFADFQLKELLRHEGDCDQIRDDLRVMSERYGIEPRRVYVGKWLEVK